jgi:hypothetical protein
LKFIKKINNNNIILIKSIYNILKNNNFNLIKPTMPGMYTEGNKRINHFSLGIEFLQTTN